VTIYAGVRTHWTIQSTNAAGCASALVVPSLNIAKRLRVGPNLIELPALKAGVLRYSCSMGMFSGAIRVVDRPAGATTGGATGG
jgi:plastocyanin domain-containing protein